MKTTLLIFVGALLSLTVIAQIKDKQSVVIGKMTTKENALLILNPPNSDQGVILPQLTTGQRMSLKPISPSEDGLTVFDTNVKSYFYWSDAKWVRALAENTRKNSFYSIDPVDFHGLQPNNTIKHNNLAVFQTDNTFVTASLNGIGEEMIAIVDVPHGAVLQELTVYYIDNDPNNLKIKLLRKSLAGNNEEIISWESSGASGNVRQQSFNSFTGQEVIDRENYTYRIVVVFDMGNVDLVQEPSQAKQRIYGVKVKYQE